MSAPPITPEELADMSVQKLLAMTVIHLGLPTSMNKGELIRNLCKKLGLEVPDLYAPTQDPRLRIKAKEDHASQSSAESSSDTAGGPVRSPKKDTTKKPYSRSQRPQRKNLNTRERPEAVLTRPLSPGVLNEATPESSPEPEDRRSAAPLATQEVAKDTVEMMSNIQKQIEALAEENKQIVKKARKIRAVATELRMQLTAERQRTERLVTYLKHWQKTNEKWHFSSIFPPQDVILKRLDGDTGETEVDEADAEYDPQLAAFLESEEGRNRNTGKWQEAATEAEDERMNDSGARNKDKGKRKRSVTEIEDESTNDGERDAEAEFTESMSKARKLSRQENARPTLEESNAEASGSGSQPQRDYLAEWKSFPVPVRPQRVQRTEFTSRYLAPVHQGPFAFIQNEYFNGRGLTGKLPLGTESDAFGVQPKQTSAGAAFPDPSNTTDSERGTRVAPASKHLGYPQTRRPLSRQGSVYLEPSAGSSSATQSGQSGRARPLSRQDSVRFPSPSTAEASQSRHVGTRPPLSRQDSMRFSPPPAPAAAPLRRAATPRPPTIQESLMFEDDPVTEEAHAILNTVFGPQASSSGGGESSRHEAPAPGDTRRGRPLTREGGFMIPAPPEAPRGGTMAPPPPPDSIKAREQELMRKMSKFAEEGERRRAGRFDPTPDGRHGRRL